MSNLLQDVEAFIKTHELAESRFGLDALDDKNLVRDLRNGRRLWPETESRVRRHMATWRPERAA